MKNITTIVCTALVVAAFTSCKGTQAVAPAIDAIDAEHNFATTTGNFEVTYHFEYLSTFADQSILQKIQEEMAAEFFGSEYARPTMNESIAAFDASLADNFGVRSGDSEFRWDGFLNITSKAAMVGNNIVTCTVDRTEDSGGAHGMEQTFHANWNLRTGARLTLDDLFTPEGRAVLGATIRAKILADKGAKDWPALMIDHCYNPEAEIMPVDNFLLSATDITFTYNPYDIACYAAGDTIVTLSLANLAGFKKEILQ